MATKTVFLFDSATGAYSGTYAAQESPLEPGVFIQPVHSTAIQPPVAGTNQVAVFASDVWSVVADFRGQTAYDQITGTPQEITAIGPLPANFALSPPPAMQLSNAQAAQNAMLFAAYQAAIAQPVSFTTAGGITKTFQADVGSVANLQASILGYAKTGATPAGFYWVAADNTQVPFIYADLQGLGEAMMTQGWTEFQHLQTQKAAVLAASTVADVQAVTW